MVPVAFSGALGSFSAANAYVPPGRAGPFAEPRRRVPLPGLAGGVRAGGGDEVVVTVPVGVGPGFGGVEVRAAVGEQFRAARGPGAGEGAVQEGDLAGCWP